MAVVNKSLENLVHYSAPDLDERGVNLGVKIPQEQKEWLRSQGNMSFHVRRAIDLYMKVMSDPHCIEKLWELEGNSFD